MLNPIFFAVRSEGHLKPRTTPWLAVVALLCLGCPGVEPSGISGSGAAGAGGPSSSTAGGEDKGGGGATSTGTSSGGKGGDDNVGGMNTGGCDPSTDYDTDAENCGTCGFACKVDDNVKEARCIGGLCRPICMSGFVDIGPPPGLADDGCEREGRRVFLASEAFPMPIPNGVEGADEKCQLLAMENGLEGSWRAWLSDDTDSPATRFDELSDVPYLRLDGATVANSWVDLIATTAAPLLMPINVTEHNLPLPVAEADAVWTGTTSLGTPTLANCGAWSGSNENQVTVGKANSITSAWTSGPTSVCAMSARLYCFEQ